MAPRLNVQKQKGSLWLHHGEVGRRVCGKVGYRVFSCNPEERGGYFILSAVRSSGSEFSVGMTGLVE